MKAPVTYSRFMPKDNADAWLDYLWTGLDWVRHDKVPRREYYCNAKGKPYSYGVKDFARTYKPQVINPRLASLWASVEEYVGCEFEVCFLNGYENQSDHLGWHSDNSPEMDDSRSIAILTFGAQREIWFRRTPEIRFTRDVVPDMDLERLTLGNGSLCVMAPGMQDTHQHRIPKASFVCGKRISLTFRGFVETT